MGKKAREIWEFHQSLAQRLIPAGDTNPALPHRSLLDILQSSQCIRCQIPLQPESHPAWVIFSVIIGYRLIKDRELFVFSVMGKRNYSGVEEKQTPRAMAPCSQLPRFGMKCPKTKCRRAQMPKAIHSFEELGD